MKIKAIVKKPVYISTPYITLDNALKISGAAETGGQAKLLIQEGMVLVNNELCLMRGKKLKDGDTFKFNEEVYEVKTR